MQSGSPTNEYFIISKDDSALRTKAYADRVGCLSNETMKSIVECLRTKPVDLLVNVKSDFWLIYGDEIMPVRHIDALKSSQFNRNIDLMYGICKNEGASYVTLFFPEIFYHSKNITKELVKKLSIRFLTSYNYHNGQEVADFYFNNLHSNATLDEYR